MKRFFLLIMVLVCCSSFIACESVDRTGQAKTPSGSSAMKGRDYESVVETFGSKGFTNIKLEKIEDLIMGWLTTDGKVEEVSVGGDFDYSPDKWVPADIEVVIRYHTFQEEAEENNEIDERAQKDEFDSSTNYSVTLANYSFDIPQYWIKNESATDHYLAYAETGSKVAMILISETTDDEDDVNFEILDKETQEGLMQKSLLRDYDEGKMISTETFETNEIKGIMYKYSFVSEGLSTHSTTLCFPSEEDNKWFWVHLVVSDNTEYQYDNDYLKIISSIKKNVVSEGDVSDKAAATESTTSESVAVNNVGVVLPQSGSKLDKDFDLQGGGTIYYINVDGVSNVPKLKNWNSAVVTDGVSEYLDYLTSLGYSVTVTNKDYREPYSGFNLYETYFTVENSTSSWTMFLSIQDERFVEYELDIKIP